MQHHTCAIKMNGVVPSNDAKPDVLPSHCLFIVLIFSLFLWTSIRQGLAPGSIYPVALLALAQEPPSEVLERLKLLDFASVDDEVAHKVFAKARNLDGFSNANF